jgi:hypothetical protein
MTRNKIFFSYSHKDKKMLEKIKTFFVPFVNRDGLIVWDDTKIEAGNEWRQEIDKALNETAVAVMLVSADFLASDFICNVELPAFIKAAESGLLKICWVLLSDCPYKQNPYISKIQAVHEISRPLDTLSKPKLNKVLNEIVSKVTEQLKMVLEMEKILSSKKNTDTVKKGNKAAPRVFLSYHPDDERQAQQIRNGLENVGIEVWENRGATSSGAQFSIEIEQTIRRSSVIIPLVTQKSTETTIVRNQTSFALEYKKFIIPILLETEIKPFLDIIDIPNVKMIENWNVGMEKLIEKIRSFLSNTKQGSVKSEAIPLPNQAQQANQNPFIFGSAVPAELFTKRKTVLNTIDMHVGNNYSLQSISIVAERRLGKTSLLNYIWKMPNQVFSSGHNYTAVYMDAMDASAHSISGFMRKLRKSIEGQLGKLPWQEKDDGNLTVLTEGIEQVTGDGERRIILLLDEFENVMAHQELDILLDTLRSNGSHSRIGMIVATAHELPDLEREGKLVSKFSNIFQTYYLGLFSKDESSQLISQAFERSGRSATDEEIERINELSGRHPCLVQLAGSLVWEMRREKLASKNIKLEFSRNAKNIFAGIHQRLTSSQLDVVKHLCGIKSRKKISENILFDLRRKGVLDESNALFSNCFADYLREELRQ